MTTQTVESLALLLAYPHQQPALALAVCNARGERDALLVLAARTDAWAALAEVAAAALVTAEAYAQSPYGPLTVLCIAAAVDLGLPVGMVLAEVPEDDPAYRMASLFMKVQSSGFPMHEWIDRLAKTDIDVCLAYQG